MSAYLFITDNVAPLSRDDHALSAWGLARGLLALKHRVTILTLAQSEQAARIPGLARRLRKVKIETTAGTTELGLFEGQFSASDPQLLVLESNSVNPSERAMQLGGAALSLAQDGLVKPEAVIGWGEASVVALARLSAAAKLFVLPQPMSGARFSAQEAESLGLTVSDSPALSAYGAIAAHAVIAPSRSAAKQLESAPELAVRPSDEPIVALQFGADEPPFDPATDPALPVPFGATHPAGKVEARRALLKRLSVSVDPRASVLGTGPRLEGAGGRCLVDALESIVKRDVFVILPAAGDRALVEKAGVIAIEHPTKIALLNAPTDEDVRLMMAACDAWWLLDQEESSGRAAGRALRYGALPVVSKLSAACDLFVQWDAGSATGNALFYGELEPAELDATVARVMVLKSDPSGWASLVGRLLSSAPTWQRTASLLDALKTAAVEEANLQAVAL